MHIHGGGQVTSGPSNPNGSNKAFKVYMEEKVTNVVKLIDEDGDSFAKRAEMYYKKRPELIHFVEESYRAYRALAERYDHISKELQNANSTLASAFPDQFQFPEDDDDDYDMPRVLKKFQKVPNPNIPKAPQKFPTKNIKAIMAFASNKKQAKPVPKSGVNGMNVPKSGLSKDEALGEIDKLQKEILTLQTEKEFAKSSYERGHAKYWEIDGDITERQEKISKLQDEFGINKAIEDDEARNLMTEAALKSCHNTLGQLQKKQEKAAAEARAERQKIKDARVKLLSLKGEILEDSAGQADASEREEENQVSVDDGVDGDKEQDLELLSEKIKEHFDVGSCTSLSVSAMAEKVDELVNKVINLETAVSSQTALIQRLRSETDELQEQIKSLEDDKANLIDGKNTLSDKLKEMENKLKELQDLDCDVKDHINHLQTSFTAAHLNLGQLSEKLHDVKPDDEIEESGEEDERKETNRVRESIDAINRLGINAGEQDVTASVLPHDGIEGEKIGKETDTNSFIPKDGVTVDKASHKASQTETNVEPTSLFINNDVASSRETSQRENEQDSLRDIQEQQSAFVTENDPNVPSNIQPAEQPKEQDEPDWQQLFVKGLEGKEKVLLDEYTSILRNFKDVKKKLNELEKKSEDNLSELTLQMKELRNSNAVKDEEIQSLRQKLIHLQKRLDEHKNSKENKDTDPAAPTDEPLLSSDKDDYESMKLMVIDQPREVSPVEEKLRADIDEILEENLDFWLRFSTSFGQIQKFQTGVKDLLAELAKLEENEKKKREGSVSSNLKSDVRPIYKHLREIQTELTVWVEQSVKLKDELQRRFSQLCHIQEKITRALNAGAEDEDMKFTSFQAAKFQGEVANMQQENNKVADELQAGMDHVTSLQLEVESTITRLDEDFGFSATRSNSDGMKSSQGRIPLRSFIFGVKPKKHKQSIFSCMHPSMMQKK